MRSPVAIGTGTFAQFELWTSLAHLDLRGRYRGSLLGPFWLTITTGALVGGIGLLYGGLFRQPLDTYFPFIAVSIVLWTFIASCLNESCVIFSSEGLVLRQMNVPASVFVTRLLYRNILILGHNAIIVVIVLAIFPPDWGLDVLMAPVGLIVLAGNLWWMSAIASVLGARFRDFAPIVGSVVQILFFITPIIWSPEALPERAFLVDANPFYHLIEIVRRPLLADGVPWTSLAISVGLLVVGSLVALRLMAWSRTRLVYWL